MRRIRSKLTYANVMSTIAVFGVLGGGTALAAYVVSSNSQIGPGTISGHKPPSGKHANVIAGSVNGQDVASNSLTGANIKEGSLGKVPSAAKANDAFSTFHDAAINMPDTIGGAGNPIATLLIPHAGSYLILATVDAQVAQGSHEVDCVLKAGGDFDQRQTVPVAGINASFGELVLQVSHSFASNGSATLSCEDGYGSDQARVIKITAVQVNNLTNSGF